VEVHHREVTAAAFPRPTGTVTLLFTDIEGSTRHWEERAAAMTGALRRHDVLLRSAIESHSGYVFNTAGDAFCAAFWRASDALSAAIHAQRAFAAVDWSAIGELRVRMALHTGAHDERDGDYFGPSVNRVARLMAAAHGGQVVVSNATAQLLRGSLPERTELLDLGEHRLKDLVEPERVYQLLVPDLPSAFPALRSLESLPNNLPRRLTPLIGRDAVVAEIGVLLLEHPIVTLVGTGGVGKTRVALQVAADVLDESSDGVWLVELAALVHDGEVGPAIAAALGVREREGQPVLDTLLNHLKSKRLLLILDNCEHVIADAATITHAIARECPEVRVLATSREPLRLEGECVYRMPSLESPPDGDPLTPAQALRYGAVALFVARAASADRTFALTEENVAIVAEICRRLDGIALAIELAAARVNVLAPRQLAQKLDERFRVLTGGNRTALPRQQTMHALIEWSYDLLSAREKALFVRLSIFSGGWTLDAACAVCAGDTVESWEVLDLVSSLVDKSLVGVEPCDEGQRYHMLESTHAFALEKLAQSGERSTLVLAHARWAADLADRTGAAATSFQNWLHEFEPELDNARAAMEGARASGEIELVARIAAGFAIIARTTHGEAEPRRWIENLLPAIDENLQPALAADLWRGLSSVTLGSRAIDAARRAVHLDERAGHPVATLRSLYWLMLGLLAGGQLEDAGAAGERALRICLEHRLTGSFRYALLIDARARIAFERRVADWRRYYEEALAVASALGDNYTLAILHLNRGELEFESGDVQAALECAHAGAEAALAGRCPGPQADALMNEAAYRLVLGDIEGARTAARSALAIAHRVQSAMTAALSIGHLAAVAAMRGDPRSAARLGGYVQGWYRNEDYAVGATERATGELLAAALRVHLNDGEIAALIALGENLTQAQAMSEALAATAF